MHSHAYATTFRQTDMAAASQKMIPGRPDTVLRGIVKV